MEDKQSIEELVKIELQDCRFHADCLALQVKKYRKWERILNIVLAISSSASIAGWAIWDPCAFVWGCIIAISQVITALKPIFPFSKHVHTLNTRCYKQEALFLELDSLWYGLQDGSISEKVAKIQLKHLKQRLNENMFFDDDDDDDFEFSKEIKDAATKMTADTLQSKYNFKK